MADIGTPRYVENARLFYTHNKRKVKRRDREGTQEKEHSQDWLCHLLFLFSGDKLGDSSLILGMMDELGKALELCFFPFGADDPVGAHALVPRGLGTEEFPGGLVGAKLFFLFASELRALSLFVRVDGGFVFVACSEGLEASWMHQALLCELSDKANVDGAPGAGGLAGGETNCVAGFVEALANAVDPAEAEGDFHGFGPGDAGLSGISFVEADEMLLELVVVGS